MAERSQEWKELIYHCDAGQTRKYLNHYPRKDIYWKILFLSLSRGPPPQKKKTKTKERKAFPNKVDLTMVALKEDKMNVFIKQQMSLYG